MFKNTFQSGFLSILYSIGSKPLQIWDKEVCKRNLFIILLLTLETSYHVKCAIYKVSLFIKNIYAFYEMVSVSDLPIRGYCYGQVFKRLFLIMPSSICRCRFAMVTLNV